MKYKIITADSRPMGFEIVADRMPDIIRFRNGEMLVYDHGSAYPDYPIHVGVYAKPVIHEYDGKLLPEPVMTDDFRGFTRVDITEWDLSKFLTTVKAINNWRSSDRQRDNVWWGPDGQDVAICHYSADAEVQYYIRDDLVPPGMTRWAVGADDWKHRHEWHTERHERLRPTMRNMSLDALRRKRESLERARSGASDNRGLAPWKFAAAIAWVNAEIARRIPSPEAAAASVDTDSWRIDTEIHR